VGSDTPASAAIAASVVFRTASPFDQFRNFRIRGRTLVRPVHAASYGNQSEMKTIETRRK
jgi:hypothetical protein